MRFLLSQQFRLNHYERGLPDLPADLVAIVVGYMELTPLEKVMGDVSVPLFDDDDRLTEIAVEALRDVFLSLKPRAELVLSRTEFQAYLTACGGYYGGGYHVYDLLGNHGALTLEALTSFYVVESELREDLTTHYQRGHSSV